MASRPHVKAIAFYLPQYHRIPENDEWWGEGFTEWTNVHKALPNFEGHYQPHVPSELGAYDLSDVDVQRRQAALAREHGLAGFCYYFYWFGGRRVLEKPLNQLLANPDLDQPYCVCWANENWTRTWDGQEKNILLAQKHSPEDDEAFFQAVLPHLKDPRYLTVDGKPMLLVYRADLFPDSKATTERWRQAAVRAGLKGLHLCAVQFYGITDPAPWGFDAAVEFSPHGFIGPENRPDDLPTAYANPRYAGGIIDYQKAIIQALRKPQPAYPWYRGVMPSWDNTARRQDTSHIFVHSSPADYEYWLRKIVEKVRALPEQHRFVFINAWNEWGEGCHLEPDVKHGRAWLEATRAALTGERVIERLLDTGTEGRSKEQAAWQAIADGFEARERALFAFVDTIRRKNQELDYMRNELRNYQENSRRVLTEFAKRELSRFPKLKGALKTVWHSIPESVRRNGNGV